ncbi:MAG: arsenate reductase (glutaredoxin), partial [Chromatocurvus sp.]
SKSRAALALLEERGVTPTIRRYLEDAPGEAALRLLLEQLGLTAAELVRRGESAYKELGLSKKSSEGELITAMAANPILIERPIAIAGDRAVIGRPPENVLALLS